MIAPRVLFGSLVIAAAAALTACNSNNYGYIAPTPGPTCAPAASSYQLVYPAPGATGVPTTTSQIVVALNTPLPNYTWNLSLTQNGSTGFTANALTTIAASQLPPGSATTTIANPVYESVQLVAPLLANVTYSVGLNNAASNCTPLAIPGATFTTQ